MSKYLSRTVYAGLVVLLGAALALPASAENDKNKGGHGDKGHGNSGKHDNDNRGQVIVAPNQVVVPYQQVVIVDRDRNVVRTYYRTEFVAGRCPPGLAKKNNGCLPPGQANRVWVVGQPLPQEIVYYPMPPQLYTQLTPPPYGYEYVRVDDRVILMNKTSRLIAAILSDLGELGSLD